MSRAGLRAAALLGLLFVIPYLASAVVARFGELFRAALVSPSRADPLSLAGDVARLAGPALAVACAAVLVAGLAQTGGVLPWNPRRESDARGNSGAQRLGLALRRALAVLALTATLLVILWISGPALGASRDAAASEGSGILLRAGYGFAIVLGGVALVDVAFTRAAWRSRLRMSRQELREEQRRTEGDRAVRGAQRRAHETEVRDPSGRGPG